MMQLLTRKQSPEEAPQGPSLVATLVKWAAIAIAVLVLGVVALGLLSGVVLIAASTPILWPLILLAGAFAVARRRTPGLSLRRYIGDLVVRVQATRTRALVIAVAVAVLTAASAVLSGTTVAMIVHLASATFVLALLVYALTTSLWKEHR
ncbi:hypothetical protein [Sanguibacter sp. Leaf3]|uniref:hypothetical protein n=1 Tax=Sanguibacter sp. Leaf3 TaxID=1736209 RepID=UPI0006FC36EE|nr:hypothetical protein [Sanguibacter sp. Leaf3]KQT98383.1 hypothetical protein ASG53_12035 [Sanguibacter sp. Leaf3]